MRTCVIIQHVHCIPVGVQVFKTSVLYDIDKDDSIGATNVIGKVSGYVTCILPPYETGSTYTCNMHNVSNVHTHNLADGSLLKSILIPTPSPPIHVALSCDSITLSVCLQESGLLKCYFYDTRGLAVQVRR